MILVNSGAFLSISSWFCKLTELIFCRDTIHFFYWLPPNNAKDYGYVQVANTGFQKTRTQAHHQKLYGYLEV